MPRLRFAIGTRFGRWRVVAEAEPLELFNTFSHKTSFVTQYLCRCGCGREVEVPAFRLKYGRSRQCSDCGRKSSARKMHRSNRNTNWANTRHVKNNPVTGRFETEKQ